MTARKGREGTELGDMAAAWGQDRRGADLGGGVRAHALSTSARHGVFCVTGVASLLAIAQTAVAPPLISGGGCRLYVECAASAQSPPRGRNGT